RNSLRKGVERYPWLFRRQRGEQNSVVIPKGCQERLAILYRIKELHGDGTMVFMSCADAPITHRALTDDRDLGPCVAGFIDGLEQDVHALFRDQTSRKDKPCRTLLGIPGSSSLLVAEDPFFVEPSCRHNKRTRGIFREELRGIGLGGEEPQVGDSHRESRELFHHGGKNLFAPGNVGATVPPERALHIGHDEFLLELANRCEEPALGDGPAPEPRMHDRSVSCSTPELAYQSGQTPKRCTVASWVRQVDVLETVEGWLIQADVPLAGLLLHGRASKRQIIEILQMQFEVFGPELVGPPSAFAVD